MSEAGVYAGVNGAVQAQAGVYGGVDGAVRLFGDSGGIVFDWLLTGRAEVESDSPDFTISVPEKPNFVIFSGLKFDSYRNGYAMGVQSGADFLPETLLLMQNIRDSKRITVYLKYTDSAVILNGDYDCDLVYAIGHRREG